ASHQGWGVVKNVWNIYGHWMEDQKKLHINILELEAIHYVFQAFKDIQNQIVLVKSDSIIAVSYLNNQEETLSSRYSETRLEQVQELGELLLDFNTQNTEESARKSSDYLHNSTLLENGCMVSSTDQHVDRPTNTPILKNLF
ncbi:14117_t:CDS:2, partial [Dentiscutata heterogama]